MPQELRFRAKHGFAFAAVALAIVVAVGGCGDSKETKNRVPTVQEQVDQAQQAAKDAQASAAAAAQTQKDIQASVDKLASDGRNSDGSLKIGRPEVSGIGIVTSVGESKSSDATPNFTFWFTFAERAGFVKTFSPVCPNQAIPVNNSVILNFHWKEYDSSNPGCYVIDGYTVVK